MTNRRQLALLVFQIVDPLIMSGCFAAAAWVALGPDNLTDFLAIRLKVVNAVLFLGLLLIWHWIFRTFGLYSSRRLNYAASEIRDLLKAVSVGSLVVVSAGTVFRIQLITPAFALLFWASSCVAFFVARVILRIALRRLRARGRNLNHVLIVGTNVRARKFAEKLRSRPELGCVVIGFLDDDWEGLEGFEAAGERVVGRLGDLRRFLRENVVDDVIMALPMSSCYRRAADVIRACELQGVTVHFFSDLFNLDLATAKVETLDGQPLIRLQTGQMEGAALVGKRAIDLAMSVAVLALLVPSFLVVMLAIKLTSAGPIFFVQERIGLNKRRFRLYKFRTMVADAERQQAELEELNEVEGPVFKIRRDPRLTPIGRFLRRTSIDELPQLFNVLKGDMSLVGPRPLPVRDYEGFDEDWHRRRFSVRPGLTCLWQVSGRSSVGFDRWMELDMHYIDQWSLGLDLRILARTIPAVLWGTGAV